MTKSEASKIRVHLYFSDGDIVVIPITRDIEILSVMEKIVDHFFSKIEATVLNAGPSNLKEVKIETSAPGKIDITDMYNQYFRIYCLQPNYI